MNRKIVFGLFGICLLLSISLWAENDIMSVTQNPNVRWRLFPTQNISTLLQLDTATGQIMQLHFAIGDSGYSGVFPLNSVNLAIGEKQFPGRFTLYPTKNMYSFILLDQIRGYSWRIQWSFEEKYRFCIPLNLKVSFDEAKK